MVLDIFRKFEENWSKNVERMLKLKRRQAIYQVKSVNQGSLF